MPPRKTASAYARPRTAIVDSHEGAGTPGVQSKTFETLSSQIADLTNTLFQTQKEVGEAKEAASVILSNNSKLQKVVEQAKSSAEEACSANSLLKLQIDAQTTKRGRPSSYTSKGNEQQADDMLDIVDDLQSAKLANTAKRCDDVEEYIDKAIKALFERVRLIKIADQHPQGWAFIREYLGSGLGKNKADDRRLKEADASLELKLKRKYDGRGNRGRRGVYRGQIDTHYGGRQDYYGQEPVYQLVNSSGGNVSAEKSVNSNSGFVHNVKPSTGVAKVIGPCYHCRGAHLVVNCPQLQEQSAEVRQQIVASYFTKK